MTSSPKRSCQRFSVPHRQRLYPGWEVSPVALLMIRFLWLCLRCLDKSFFFIASANDSFCSPGEYSASSSKTLLLSCFVFVYCKQKDRTTERSNMIMLERTTRSGAGNNPLPPPFLSFDFMSCRHCGDILSLSVKDWPCFLALRCVPYPDAERSWGRMLCSCSLPQRREQRRQRRWRREMPRPSPDPGKHPTFSSRSPLDFL